MTPTDIATLIDLRERVRAAPGPDRELGARVICAVPAPAGSFVEQSRINGAWCIYMRKDRSWEKPRELRGQDITESIDAAVALIERVLPMRLSDGVRWHLFQKALSNALQWQLRNERPFTERLPIAFVEELLSALIAKAESEGSGRDG